MSKWFIFTSRGGVIVMEGDTITKAVSAFKRLKHRDAGEILGVIKAGATMETYGRPMATPVFGVICCVADDRAISPPKF